jgi:histidinol dehydrogenase
VPDDPTLGEIARRLEAVHADLKEDLREYGNRLDKKVSLERYQLEQQARDAAVTAAAERVRALEEAREQDLREADRQQRAVADRRRADRRLLFTALVAPVLLLLVQVYINAQGAAL